MSSIATCAAPLVGAALLLSGPAHAGSVQIPAAFGGAFAVPVTSLKEAAFRLTLRQQHDFSCGSAALATLLTYHYGHPVTEQAVFQEMFERGDRDKIKQEGFSLLDMKTFLEPRGFAADGFESSLDNLAAANIPAIVLLRENGYNHFVVIKGLRDGRVLVGDPAVGTRAMPRERFESLWANRIVFIIHNRQDAAGFNLAADWRVAPRAPIAGSVNRASLDGLVLPKRGAGDI